MKTMVFALMLTASALFPVQAGEVQDLAKDAEAKAAAGRNLEAVDSLRRALTVLTAKGPLALRKVQFIAEPPKGFGIYQKRANNVFPQGEPLIIYAEPVGMGWRAEGGANRARVMTDFQVRTPDGKILGGQKDFGRFDFASHEENHEIMTHLTIRLTGAPPGRYVIDVTYRDQMNNKSASFELPFEIK